MIYDFCRNSLEITMAEITFATHEQAMACLNCGLAGFTPSDYFPQEPGPWDRPCPNCGETRVWVTETRRKAEENAA